MVCERAWARAGALCCVALLVALYLGSRDSIFYAWCASTVAAAFAGGAVMATRIARRFE